jgi:hypothetical protein
VHRSRKKARAAVGALAAFTLSITMAFGALAAVSANDAKTPPTIADNGSTQNGKSNAPAITVLASTQNGSHGTSMGGDGTGSDGTTLPA